MYIYICTFVLENHLKRLSPASIGLVPVDQVLEQTFSKGLFHLVGRALTPMSHKRKDSSLIPGVAFTRK